MPSTSSACASSSRSTCPRARPTAGTVIHGALSEFTKSFAAALPPDPAAALIEIGAKHFAALDDYPEARALWWPRFRRIADWFAAWETARRGRIAGAHGGDIRQDRHPGRRPRIHAALPRRPHRAGRRWPLRHSRLQDRVGADREAGAHRHLAAAHPRSRDPAPGRIFRHRRGRVAWTSSSTSRSRAASPRATACRSISRMATPTLTPSARSRSSPSWLTRFEDEQQPYLPLVLSMWKSRYGTYDHLARVKEWSVGSDEDEIAGGGE